MTGDMLIRLRDSVAEYVRQSKTTGPVLLAVFIGAGSGGAAVALRWAVEAVQALFQDGLGGGLRAALEAVHPVLGGLWVVPVIALGGLCAGLAAKWFAPETRGHGVPEVMAAVARTGGRLRARVAVVKLAAAALTIGSGGSAGREGPIVHIGATWGSALAQFLRFPDRMVTLCVACGAAGGIAATFNAPMAGVLFTLEVVVRRFTTRYFGLVVISSAVATVTMRALSRTGDYPWFPLHQGYRLVGMRDLLLFLVLGALCAVVARSFVRALEGVETAAGRLRMNDALKPALGGALTGLFALLTPQIMGSGYGAISDALNNRLAGGLLLAAVVTKILATALTVGSGGAGGVFVPCLFIGAMFGGAYGTLVHEWFPLVTSSPGAYALVGMSAVFAAGAHAPMTGIIILIEMTDNYHIVLPLMAATVLSTFIAQRMSPDSLYTGKLREQGIDFHESPEVNLMEALTVAEAMDEVVDCVSENTPVAELAERLRHDHERGYPVVNLDGDLTGIVTMRDVQEALLGGDPGTLRVGDICTRGVVVCRPDDTLGAALSQFGMHAFGRMPVINPDNPKRLVGMLKRSGILDAYLEARRDRDGSTARGDEMQFSRRAADMVLEEALVASGSPLAGRPVRDAGIPEDAVLGAIRRGQETLTPRGSTVLQPGDALFFITTRTHAEEVRQWIKESA